MDPLFWDCEFINPEYLYKRKPAKKVKDKKPKPSPVNNINIIIRQDKQQTKVEEQEKLSIELFNKVLAELEQQRPRVEDVETALTRLASQPAPPAAAVPVPVPTSAPPAAPAPPIVPAQIKTPAEAWFEASADPDSFKAFLEWLNVSGEYDSLPKAVLCQSQFKSLLHDAIGPVLKRGAYTKQDMVSTFRGVMEKVRRTSDCLPIEPIRAAPAPEIDINKLEQMFREGLAKLEAVPTPAAAPVPTPAVSKWQKVQKQSEEALDLALDRTILIGEAIPKQCKEKANKLGVDEMPEKVYDSARDLIDDNFQEFLGKYYEEPDFADKFIAFQEKAKDVLRTVCQAYVKEQVGKSPPYVSKEWLETFVTNKLNV